jgi:MFS family permease
MLTCDGVRAIVEVFVATMLLTGQMTLPLFVVTMAIFGGASAFFGPAATGLVPQTVRPAGLQQANALLSLTSGSASLIGPTIGGALVATIGSGWAFVGDGASFAISAFFLAALRLPARARTAQTTNFLADLKVGWREFTAQRWMVAIDVWAVVANMLVIGPFYVLGPLVAKRELGGASAWAIILAASGVGSILGDFAALALRPRRPLVLGCLVVSTFAIPLGLLAIPAPSGAIAAGAFAATFGLTVFNTLFVTTMQEQVPAEALSRVTAYDWLASVAFLPLGYALAGPLAELVGLRELLLAGAAFDVAGALVLVALPSVRAIERHAAAA